MKRVVFFILIFGFCTSSFGEETRNSRENCGMGAICAQKESSVLSMMGWGIGIFAGIAVLCSLVDNNSEDSSGTNSHSH